MLRLQIPENDTKLKVCSQSENCGTLCPDRLHTIGANSVSIEPGSCHHWPPIPFSRQIVATPLAFWQLGVGKISEKLLSLRVLQALVYVYMCMLPLHENPLLTNAKN